MPAHSEILRPSFTTKACVVASIVFTMDKNSAYINLPSAIIYLVSYLKLSSQNCKTWKQQKILFRKTGKTS